MSGVFHEASELGFEASYLRVNTACFQKRCECPSQKTDRLRIARRDLEVVLDRVRDGHEGTLVVSPHLLDGTIDPAYFPQRRFVNVRKLFRHAPERT